MGKHKNHTGYKFNMMTIIGEHNVRASNGSKIWEAKCDCGNNTLLRADQIDAQYSCGCKRWEDKRVHNRCIDCGKEITPQAKRCKSCAGTDKNLTGKIFNELTVIRDSGKRYKKRNSSEIIWLAECSCGNKTTIKTSQAISGDIKSCGCLLFVGKIPSKENLVKRSESMRDYWTDDRKASVSGENSILWKGGERKVRDRKTAPYKEWRTSVFKRDGYKCQKCGKGGGDLNAHHICSWKEHKQERFNIDNGITLCELHHNEFHSTYKYIGFTPDNLVEYLNLNKEFKIAI